MYTNKCKCTSIMVELDHIHVVVAYQCKVILLLYKKIKKDEKVGWGLVCLSAAMYIRFLVCWYLYFWIFRVGFVKLVLPIFGAHEKTITVKKKAIASRLAFVRRVVWFKSLVWTVWGVGVKALIWNLQVRCNRDGTQQNYVVTFIGLGGLELLWYT